MRQVYARYPSPDQTAQRKAFLQAVAAAALAKVLSGTGDPQARSGRWPAPPASAGCWSTAPTPTSRP